MKKLFLSLILLLLIIVGTLGGVLFFRPGLIVNPKVLSFVLHRVSALKDWRWENAIFVHERRQWNERGFSGSFSNFCLHSDAEALGLKTCLEKVSWDVNILYTFPLEVKVTTNAPFLVRSSFTHITLHDQKEEKGSGPPDIYGYWKLFWSDVVPDMDFAFADVRVKKIALDVKLVKKKKELFVSSKGFALRGNPQGFVLEAPEKYPLPKKLPLAVDPVHFIGVKLRGDVTEKGIPLKLTGKLESIDFLISSELALPLEDELDSLTVRENFLLNLRGQVSLKDIRKNMRIYGPKPYTELPAPFNVMDGGIGVSLRTEKLVEKKTVLIKALTEVELRSEKQSLVFDVSSDVPLDLVSLKPSQVGVGIEFEEVMLQLPRFSKKSPPPQFMPDGRFKKKVELPKKEEKPFPLNLSLKASEASPLGIRTDLLDEILRLSFDISVEEGKLTDGFVKILPLKTTVFKRPIRLEEFKLDLGADSPVLNARLKFPLPEYKITLKLEGPVSQPRYAFESEPPLPQNDIYAVLLFGRPLADLDPDDKTAANKTNEILSQGILSLSVLYFLAGSPVEYVGYDPGSKNATAQFGLGNKSSLRIGGGQEGVNSTAIRRSLGKGWYLDTSVQNSSNRSTSNSTQTKNYGVLLERIISY